jgi:hypothetical protein
VVISATPAAIQSGQSSTLFWTSINAATASIDQGIGSVAVNDDKVVRPVVTTTYTITATNPLGTATAAVTVTVGDQPMVSLTATPAAIQSGQSSTLSWTSTNATSASINQGIGSVPVNGSQVVTPAATTSYTLTVTGPGGTTNVSVTVTVSEPLPAITFTATPEFIPPGGSSTLTWTTTNATSVAIDNGIGPVDLSGSKSVSPAQETVYTIIATGPGGTAIASATVRMLNTHLNSIWNDMKTAMISGNIDQAANFFDEETKANYLDIFNAISNQLPQLATDMRDIEPVYFEDAGAQFRIKRREILAGTEYDVTYYIYFVRGEDGIWRILKY